MRSFAFFLAVALTCAAVPGICVSLGRVSCQGTIPVDSQYLLDPVWSLSPFRERLSALSGGSLTFTKVSLPAALAQQVVSEAGMDINSVTVFESKPAAMASSDELESIEDESQCSVKLDPLRASMDGVVSRAARVTVIAASGANGNTCSLPLTITLTSSDRKSTAAISFDDSSLLFSKSIVFGTSGEGTWPVTMTFSSTCAVQFLLLVDRHGALNRWYVWIPSTVYTAVVVAALLPVVLLRKRLSVHLAGLYLFLVFLGFFGSCLGLIVELVQWQSVLGRMFPFPSSVTLHCCLAVLYGLLLVPVLYRQGNNTVLLMGTVRLLTYGLNCALCVGYWIAGYVVLGSLAVFQLLVTNVILTGYYAYVTVHLRRAMRSSSALREFSDNFLYLWCAPVTPFACCALLYYDLFLLTQRDIKRDSGATRMRDVVRVYNAQMSLPLLFFQNVYGAALLAAACAFHMPLVVLLFVSLLLWFLHATYVVEQYVREWARWHRRGGSLSVWGCLSLTAVMDSLLTGDTSAASPSRAASPGLSQAQSHSSQSVRRRPHAEQYERDLAAQQERPMSWSSASDEESFDDSSSWRRRHPRPPDRDAAFTTPARQTVNDVLDYWPSSVER